MFRNREDAAQQLAHRLRNRELHDPLVLGIPRGGVVLAAVLARQLHAELDVVLARKIRAPGQPEAAIGAVAETGEVFLNPSLDTGPDGPLAAYIEEESRFQFAEITRRKKRYRAIRPRAEVTGRSVIVTDDGVATGATMIAALKAIRAQQPRELIVAVPVIAAEHYPDVRAWCDEVVYLLKPENLWAVGQFYAHFEQVSDAEVLELLRPPASLAS